MTWQRNTGAKPGDLDGNDQVHVKLRNGLERGPWKVRTSAAHAIDWRLHGYDFDVIEWKRA